MANNYYTPGCGDIVDAANNQDDCTIPMHWMPEEVFKLIDLVKADPAIYNPQYKNYYSHNYIDNFWRTMDIKLNKRPGECISKWTQLRVKFRRETSNFVKEKIRPCWSYFDRMLFLQPYLRRREDIRQSNDRLESTVNAGNSLSNMTEANDIRNPGQTPSSSHDIFMATRGRIESAMYENGNGNGIGKLDGDYKKLNSIPMSHEQPQRLINSTCDNQNNMDAEDTPLTAFFIGHATSRLHKSEENRQAAERLRQQRMPQARPEPFNVYGTRPTLISRPPNLAQHNSKPNSLNSPGHLRTIRDYPTRMTATSCSGCSSQQMPDYATKETHGGVPSNESVPQTEYVDSASALAATPLHCDAFMDKLIGLDVDDSGLIHKETLELSNLLTEVGKNDSNSDTALQAGASCQCKTDPDAMFFMSLLPDFRKIDPRRRSQVKMEFQRILFDCIYSD